MASFLLKFRVFCVIAGLGLSLPSIGQNTITTTGNWIDPGIWSGANVADNIGENVLINSTIDVTVQLASTFTVGNITTSGDNDITVAGTLEVGDSGNPRDVNAATNTNVEVSGSLVIWGDLIVNDDLTLFILPGGSVVIHGDVTVDNGGALAVDGDLTINGNFSSGNNTLITVDGTVDIAGDFTSENNTSMIVDGVIEIDGNFTSGDDTNVFLSGTITVDGTTDVGDASDLNGLGTFYALGGCSSSEVGSDFCESGTLPVTLVEFTGVSTHDGVELHWRTATEDDNSHFEIQKLVGEDAFVTIGSVEGAGTTTQVQNYFFLDAEAAKGNNYYRLRQMDFSGTFEYFHVISVLHVTENDFSVYPNPTNGRPIVVSGPSGKIDARVVMYDNMGNRVFAADSFTNELVIEPSESQVKPGLYHLDIQAGNKRIVRKIVVN